MDTVHETLFIGISKKKNTKFLKIFLCVISYMEYLYCIYYKCNYVVCEIFFPVCE